jgi:hypothetical protein
MSGLAQSAHPTLQAVGGTSKLVQRLISTFPFQNRRNVAHNSLIRSLVIKVAGDGARGGQKFSVQPKKDSLGVGESALAISRSF